MLNDPSDYMETRLRLQLHSAIYRPDSFVLMLRYCENLKAIRYESTSLKKIVADKSHRVIVALRNTTFSHALRDQCIQLPGGGGGGVLATFIYGVCVRRVKFKPKNMASL